MKYCMECNYLYEHLKLIQEADIIFKQQAHIFNAVPQHGYPLDTHAESKSGI
jgi:hypothetical protein